MFIFLLALTACLEIQFSQARQLKENAHNKNLQPIPSKELSSSDASHSREENGFQPTTPGNSPGVGHSFAGQKRNYAQSEGQDFDSVKGKTDGFQPTTPGHSPGVGHALGNLKEGPNA